VTVELAATVAERGVDLALTIDDGETVALLGPNGSGKSTALGVVAGLVVPDHGHVVLDGRTLTRCGRDAEGGRAVHVPPHDRRTALLGQEPLLFPHLSALDNVAFGPRSRGTTRRGARTLAQHWLDQTEVGELAERRSSQLSGGQAQRVALARALAADPDLLLLDEPMAALDVAVTPGMRQTLRRVLAGRTALVVTHDPLDALLMTDRVVVLDKGTVVEDGPSSQVLTRPRSGFAARLAGLNLVRGTWQDDHVVTADGMAVQGLLEDGALAAGAEVVATFRPAAVAVYREAPHGSPRNSFPVTITELEALGDLVRVRAGSMSADVTVQAAADLELAQGNRVTFTVKATEVSVYAL
jgi:molybdate transport system ATP-binding protein